MQKHAEQAGIAFVVPYRARPGEEVKDVVEWCLEPLVAQLGPQDVLVVSDQGSSLDVVAELQEGAIVSVDPTPPALWNIARARNLGRLAAQAALAYAKAPRSHAYLWTIDADIRVPDGAVEAARRAMDAGAPGLAPLVKDDGDGSARTRPGSGIAILPAAMVAAVGGWDETFIGYGSEDIDLFYRLGKRFDGWRCELWQTGPVFLHRPHGPQPDKIRLQRTNLERLREKHGDAVAR